MTKGKIIVLNGVSSAGKSSLARRLQEVLPDPWFHLSLDTFDSMIHSGYLEHVSSEQFLQSSCGWPTAWSSSTTAPCYM